MIHCPFLFTQPLDIAIFRPWRANFERKLSLRLRLQKVGVRSIIELATDTWNELFVRDGAPTPNHGAISAFRDVGIMPYNPHALPDSVFEPAELAGKALAAVQAKAGITMAQRMEIVEAALPFVPAVPVDMESARGIARRRRPQVPELLTSVALREAQASKLLDEEAKEQAKKQKSAQTAQKRLERDKERKEKAAGIAARKAARLQTLAKMAGKPPTTRRRAEPKKAIPAAAAVPEHVAEPSLAGQKRTAASAGMVGGGSSLEGKVMLRIARKQPRPDGAE